jgi:hypothetical protein
MDVEGLLATADLVFAPLGPAGSAKPARGMRQRPCGFFASPLHMGFDRSAMLLTGLGFESGFMPFRRNGKPHTMDSRTRSPVTYQTFREVRLCHFETNA